MSRASDLLRSISRQVEKERALQNDPSVGIFWMMRGQMISHVVPFRASELINQYYSVPVTHYSLWKSLIKQRPELRSYRFNDLERGRVAKSTLTNKFYIFTEQSLLGNDAVLRLVARDFKLQGEDIEFALDLNLSREKFL